MRSALRGHCTPGEREDAMPQDTTASAGWVRFSHARVMGLHPIASCQDCRDHAFAIDDGGRHERRAAARQPGSLTGVAAVSHPIEREQLVNAIQQALAQT
jgi:hypothetical protein